MKVTFMKTGERRYGVYVQRESGPAMIASPAPGFHEYLPHDLLHFVAEAEWGLDGAVFGQLAAGGDPGVFHATDETLIPRMYRRKRQRTQPKPRGRRSEVLAHILETAWEARHGVAPLPEDWEERLAAARVEPQRRAEVLERVDVLAAEWHALQIGRSLTLEWPRPERRARPRAAPQKKRAPKTRRVHAR